MRALSLVSLLLLFVVAVVGQSQNVYRPATTNVNCCGVNVSLSGYVNEIEPNNNIQQAMNLECHGWVQSGGSRGTPDVEASAADSSVKRPK